jgi:hypothetical protein
MHYSTNPEEIKTEIQKLWLTVTNIWNFKIIFVELKPVWNNQDIFNVEYIQQYKIKFERNKIAQCVNCQRYGHNKFIATSILDAPNAQVTTN